LLQATATPQPCPELRATGQRKLEAAGTAILQGAIIPKNGPAIAVQGDTFALDLGTGQLTKLNNDNETILNSAIAVSPDRLRLAYVLESGNNPARLIISNGKAGSGEIVPWSANDTAIRGWLGDQRLFLTPFVVLDLGTNKQQAFSLEKLPEFYALDYRQEWLSLDPEVTRAVYMTSESLALTDLGTNQILARVAQSIDRTPVAAWSPDGSQVAAVGTLILGNGETAEEAFILDRDGHSVRQITQLSNNYGSNYNLYNLAWSPDGRSIAFWQYDASTPTGALRLFRLDTETQELTDLCTWGPGGRSAYYGPIWSPDGLELLIERQGATSIDAVTIDLQRNIAHQLAENMIPVGWMK
jgi:WD40 repeat protein